MQALPLASESHLDPLLERIGDARIVLLGEASHGTAEYYTWRAALTRRLVEEKGFGIVAVEGDWASCFEVNRSVRGRPGVPEPRVVLDGFERWPTWMWANQEVVYLTRWMRTHNLTMGGQDVGFYGLDVYGLWESMRELLRYLREHEPEHVDQALKAIRCFEPYGEEPQDYAFTPSSCQAEVVELLCKLCTSRAPQVDGDPEERFAAEQNAAVAAGAERYYSAMLGGSGASWNVRDTHMADTLDRLLDFHGGKAVVWEHNTHIGDARATDMAAAGMVNVGQLVRERHPGQSVSVGFGSHRGTVIAADRWGGAMKRMDLPEAMPGSLEDVLHQEIGHDALFLLEDESWAADRLGHRAVGVVYAPERERFGNYVPTVLADRYDAFMWLEQTSALHPLHLERTGTEIDTWPYAV